MNPVHEAGWHLHESAWAWSMYFRGEGEWYRDVAIGHLDEAGNSLGKYDPPDPSSVTDLILDRLDTIEDRLDAIEPPEPYDFDKWAGDLAKKSTPEAVDLAKGIWSALDKLAGAWR